MPELGQIRVPSGSLEVGIESDETMFEPLPERSRRRTIPPVALGNWACRDTGYQQGWRFNLASARYCCLPTNGCVEWDTHQRWFRRALWATWHFYRRTCTRG